MEDMDPGHRQTAYSVRLEWGPTGADAIGPVDAVVVVDVLSFTTAVTVGVARGTRIFPFRWRDERAQEYADRVGATLARRREDGLSPAALQYGRPVQRLVLPSPNGSTITASVVDATPQGPRPAVVAGSLRNASAVARWLWGRAGTVAVVPAGERWPDGSLRPAVEDLWGAGAVIAALVDLGQGGLSPEARVAEQSFRAVRGRLGEELATCASGRELIAKGYRDDVVLGAEHDVSTTVPVLGDDGAYAPAPA